MDIKAAVRDIYKSWGDSDAIKRIKDRWRIVAEATSCFDKKAHGNS